jgi:hypothetical protein
MLKWLAAQLLEIILQLKALKPTRRKADSILVIDKSQRKNYLSFE